MKADSKLSSMQRAMKCSEMKLPNATYHTLPDIGGDDGGTGGKGRKGDSTDTIW